MDDFTNDFDTSANGASTTNSTDWLATLNSLVNTGAQAYKTVTGGSGVAAAPAPGGGISAAINSVSSNTRLYIAIGLAALVGLGFWLLHRSNK